MQSAIFLSGQLMVRPFKDGKSAMVGLVELPPEFVPEEGAAYLMAWRGTARVHPQKLSDLPREHIGGGANDWLLAPIWQGTVEPGVTMVRFLREFPEKNVWAVLGAQNQELCPLVSEILSKEDHPDVWLTVKNGEFTRLKENPCPDRGQTVGQMLRAPVWPHEGDLWSLATLDTQSRKALLKGHQIMLKYGQGLIDKAQCKEELRKDGAVWDLCYTSSTEEGYAQFLTKMNEHFPIQEEQPMAKDMVMQRERLSTQLIRQILAEKLDRPENLPKRPAP